MRLDQALVERGLLPTRARAQAAVLAGLVFVNGVKEEKAGTTVAQGDLLDVKAPAHPWASRGGLKLEKALEVFSVEPEGAVCLDCGASTGGFTDVLLSQGARRVHAVDVGYGLIDWRLRQDARVRLLERTNLRYLTPDIVGEPVEIVTLDLSFIGLEKVFPAVGSLLSPDWRAVLALVKPQFQVGKGKVGKGGIVREPSLHKEAILSVLEAGTRQGWEAFGCIPSPIRGADGNIEFWLPFGPPRGGPPVDVDGAVEAGQASVKGPR